MDEFDSKSTILRFCSFQKRHFSDLIGLEIEKLLIELQVSDKVTSITCDGAPNMIKMFDYLSRSDITRIRCQAHVLHLVVCNGLGLWMETKKKKNVTTNETNLLDSEIRLSHSLKKINIIDDEQLIVEVSDIENDRELTEPDNENEDSNDEEDNSIAEGDSGGNSLDEYESISENSECDSEHSAEALKDNFEVEVDINSNDSSDSSSTQLDTHISLIVEKSRQLIGLIKDSSILSSFINRKANEYNQYSNSKIKRSLILDVGTRWNSSYKMLATRAISGSDYPMIGITFYIFHRLEKDFLSKIIPTDDPLFNNMKKSLLSKMIYYTMVQDPLQTKTIMFYGYFDPYAISVMTNTEINTLENEIKYIIRHKTSNSSTQASSTTSSNTTGLSRTEKNFKKSLLNYFVDSLADEDSQQKLAGDYVSTSPDSYNPVQFWKENKSLLPNLTPLAQKYLASPSTSTKSESAFSISAYYGRKQRARLSSVNLGG
ncbi:unnamed protein product [Rotaria sp. Silwood1]|nr:unnamed protein product [Rotaria sp. Silwood1]CAF1519126.1 unnamed protein product [Rotaria sp. Silwood1]